MQPPASKIINGTNSIDQSQQQTIQQQQQQSIFSIDGAVQLGKLYTIDQNDGTSFNGFVHTYDKLSNLICIELVPTAQIVLLSLHNIKSISPPSTTTSSSSSPTARKWTHVPQSIDLNKLRNEEDRVFRKRHKEFGLVGMNLSHSQVVFNTLSKTLPCKLEGDCIVIFDTVRLKHPYTIHCISGDGSKREVERVRLVLQNETPNIQKATNVAAAAAAAPASNGFNNNTNNSSPPAANNYTAASSPSLVSNNSNNSTSSSNNNSNSTHAAGAPPPSK